MVMKQTRKGAAVLLSLLLTLLPAMPALAVGETYSITIVNEAEGHAYEAYQIFQGDLSGKVLSNVGWGDSVDGAGLLEALKAADSEKCGACPRGADVAKARDGGEGGPAAADAEAFAGTAADYLTAPKGSVDAPVEGKYAITGLPAGYYLVKDRDNSLEGSEDAYTNYIVRVVMDVEMAPKSDVPRSEKKVKDINDSESLVHAQWQDTADHDIGDRIPFRLMAALPANYSTYGTYALTFHDTESQGLTFQSDSVKVYIDGKPVDDADYSVVTEGIDCTFEVRFADLKTVTAAEETKAGNNSVVTVEYESVLNERAVVGAAGNPNDMYITFSNNPNGEGTGRTPEDTVIVFTYKVVINKVDNEQAALPGAAFTLEKKIKGEAEDVWETVEVLGAEGDLTTFAFVGLDDGEYRLTESRTPAGYNTVEPIEFTVTAAHEDAGLRLTSLSGNAATGEILFTPVVDDGSLTAAVINSKGVELPETGGIGTVVFYVLGGVLAAGAGLLLVVRRRMKTENR